MARLPILMYHRVTLEEGEGLTISIDKLRAQFTFLIAQGYRSWHFAELLDLPRLPEGRHVVITFDDATIGHRELVYPLLVEMGLKGVFFLPMAHLGKTDSWNEGEIQILEAKSLLELDPEVVEFGYHSFRHDPYDQMSHTEIAADLVQAREEAKDLKLPMSPVLAYPYGKYPRKGSAHLDFCEMLRLAGIRMGLRIGNRVNRFPLMKPYEVQRIDVKGEFSATEFAKRLKRGKRWF